MVTAFGQFAGGGRIRRAEVGWQGCKGNEATGAMIGEQGRGKGNTR